MKGCCKGFCQTFTVNLITASLRALVVSLREECAWTTSLTAHREWYSALLCCREPCVEAESGSFGLPAQKKHLMRFGHLRGILIRTCLAEGIPEPHIHPSVLRVELFTWVYDNTLCAKWLTAVWVTPLRQTASSTHFMTETQPTDCLTCDLMFTGHHRAVH